jgi:hypothetical protein
MSVAASGPGATSGEATRMLASLAWVAVATALTLAGLGAVPGWLAGESREVRPVASVEEAERWLGARLAIPSYFPSRLGWPPAVVEVAGGRGGAASFTFHALTEEGSDIQLLQASTPGVPIPAALLAVANELSTTRATVGARPATLARVLVEGKTWLELRWERDGRAMVLRTQGDVEELLRMARSAHRQGAP